MKNILWTLYEWTRAGLFILGALVIGGLGMIFYCCRGLGRALALILGLLTLPFFWLIGYGPKIREDFLEGWHERDRRGKGER